MSGLSEKYFAASHIGSIVVNGHLVPRVAKTKGQYTELALILLLYIPLVNISHRFTGTEHH